MRSTELEGEFKIVNSHETCILEGHVHRIVSFYAIPTKQN